MSPASATVIAPLVAMANGPVPSPSESVFPERNETVDADPSVIVAVMTAALSAALSAREAEPAAIVKPTSVTDAVNVCVAASLVPSSMTMVNS
mgnify:CR=1 FL=1